MTITVLDLLVIVLLVAGASAFFAATFWKVRLQKALIAGNELEFEAQMLIDFWEDIEKKAVRDAIVPYHSSNFWVMCSKTMIHLIRKSV